MPDQIIPPPVLIDQNISYWPGPRRQGNAAAMTDNGCFQFDVGIDNRLIMSRAGTTVANVFPSGTGVVCITIGDAGTGLSTLIPQDTIGAHPLTLIDASLNAACVGPEYLRVTRHLFWFRVIGAGVGSISDATGVGLFRPEAAVAGGIPTGGNPGFGLFGDGSGALRYANFQGGAFPGNRTETVALPAGTIASLAEWNQFEVQLINSAPGRNASMSLFVNNTLIVSRNWTGATGATLADYSLAPGGLGTCIHGPTCFVDETVDANVGVEVAQYMQYRGRYDRDGTEILT